jgi:predicted nucleic acid-binding protein
VLPEVDYLTQTHLGPKVEAAFLEDLAEGRYRVEWSEEGDLSRAHEIATRYRSLKLGLTDTAVMAIAERLGAAAIATLDLRHFGAVKIIGAPKLLPRDL